MKIATHSNNEKTRFGVLESHDVIDTIQEHKYHELIELAAKICNTPMALITFIDEKQQWFKLKTGIVVNETHRDFALCAHTILQNDNILIVPDARKDARFSDQPVIKQENGIVFYAGVSLINDEGNIIGSICVLSNEKKSLSNLQIQTLKVLAKQVINHIELDSKLLELQYRNQTLLESYNFIEKFAERAAHDLKNPLSSIILTSQALKARLTNQGELRSIKLVDIMVDAGKSLTSYINELLDYSKSPSSVKFQSEEFELVYILEKATNLIDVPANCRITLPKKPLYLIGCKFAFEQILLNLLTNAVRYNDKNDPRIAILFEEDQNSYYLQVNDNGKGISAEDQLRIFDHGFISKQPDRNNVQGSGIGMNIVKCLMDKLGGKIAISSEVGIGTSISLEIPKKLPSNKLYE